MLIGTIKILFSISAILFCLLIILHKQFTLKVKDNVKISNFVALIAFSLVAYIICALMLGIFTGGIKFRVLMLVFAVMPFIIGRTAKFHTYKLLNSLQMLIMLISAVIVCAR